MVVTNNPLYSQQWHFNLIGDIDAVWEDYTGTGIQVGVYDDGTEQGHEDLNGNYDSSLHYSGVFGSDDGQPNNGDASHGTAVAGIIASENNGVGGVGVAYDSTITGVDLLEDLSPSGGFSATLEALEWMENFDVTNNSWGYTPTYSSFLDLTNASSQASREVAAMSSATETGRDGLGTIIVKAAGNDNNDSFFESLGLLGNAQGEGHNSAHTIITVAAADQNGNIEDYSNWGVNLLISGPAASVTTDQTGSDGYSSGEYTTTFGGTSAATPVVAGVVALMLDANEGLGWRDVQNIIAISASHTGSSYGDGASGFEEGEWFSNGATNWNGGGMSYNISYGFGIIDAFAAVRMAEVWDRMFDAAQVTSNELTATASFSGTAAIQSNDTTFITVSTTESVLVEHIYVTIFGSHTYLGDLSIRLVSPTGEVYELLRNEGGSEDLEGSWTFGVAAALGIMANAGDWVVEISDNFAADDGVVTGVDLNFHGSAATTNTVHHITMDFEEYASQEADRRTIADTDGGIDWLNMVAVTGDVYLDLFAAGDIVVDGSLWANIDADTDMENAALGDGNDTVVGNTLANEILGGRGNDSISGGSSDDTLEGGNGEDTLSGGNSQDMLDGGNDNDSLDGNNGNDTIYGGAGNDTVDGGNQSDMIDGGLNEDVISGGAGNDTIYGGSGSDSIYGGANGDVIKGDNGFDLVNGGEGSDTLSGNNGNDTIYGEGGNDRIWGGNNFDLIYGGSGYERIFAGNGNDTVYADDGRDRAFLGDGDDVFHDNDQTGARAADRIFGGSGEDTIYLGGGNDRVSGGSGADTFVFDFAVIESDRINDFEVGTDSLHLSTDLWGGTALSVAQVIDLYGDDSSGTVIFDFENGNVIRLQGVNSLSGLEDDMTILT
ncbi:S8 family serine peptidase [Tateyamaria sp. SN6-1]|uniref:S8 family serine peptidase n=1 Tax=Tateyamaria sp. SN6-1 TaxID=3092148 RepID=UPI0039F49D33